MRQTRATATLKRQKCAKPCKSREISKFSTFEARFLENCRGLQCQGALLWGSAEMFGGTLRCEDSLGKLRVARVWRTFGTVTLRSSREIRPLATKSSRNTTVFGGKVRQTQATATLKRQKCARLKPQPLRKD